MRALSSEPVERAVARLEELGRISDHPEFLTRSFLSPANLRAARLVGEWMAELGMEVEHAVDGTMRGMLAGTAPGAAPLLLGSHLDTVVDAGRFDGALGIVVALAAVEALRQEGRALPFPMHVLAFSDEEGSRFHTTYLGSRSLLGPLDAGTLSRRDEAGESLASVLRAEGWHEGAREMRYRSGETLGYVEVHIEQGRVLQEEGLAVASVSSIAGQSRLAVTLHGRADHAGTTPMGLRRDALGGAAACVLAAEELARAEEGAVVTVGKLKLHPDVSNTIPQRARLTVDLRHAVDAVRERLRGELERLFREVAEGRGLELEWEVVQESAAVPCDGRLREKMMEAVGSTTGRPFSMMSGAGHDAVALSARMPVAMLFVRCREGLSHHPDEYATPEDVEVGIMVLREFLLGLA
ncbi:MAG: M20 family metallo-hydrolase [Verrucomicrobiota bacterium]